MPIGVVIALSFITGAMFGVFIMTLCAVARKDDDNRRD